MFTIQTKHLKALLHVAAKKDIRYYLNGICLDTTTAPGLLHLYATDGHALARIAVPAPDAPAVRVILGRDDITHALKAAPARTAELTLTLTDDRKVWSTGGAGYPCVEGTYPDAGRVITEPTDGALPPLDPRLLSRAMACAEACAGGASYMAVRLRAGNGSNLRIECPHTPELVLVVMGMRV